MRFSKFKTESAHLVVRGKICVWEKDKQKGKYLGLQTKNCIIYNDTNVIIGTVSVEDLIIVATGKGVLVCKKTEAGLVNDFVKKLEKSDYNF